MTYSTIVGAVCRAGGFPGEIEAAAASSMAGANSRSRMEALRGFTDWSFPDAANGHGVSPAGEILRWSGESGLSDLLAAGALCCGGNEPGDAAHPVKRRSERSLSPPGTAGVECGSNPRSVTDC